MEPKVLLLPHDAIKKALNTILFGQINNNPMAKALEIYLYDPDNTIPENHHLENHHLENGNWVPTPQKTLAPEPTGPTCCRDKPKTARS